MFFTWDEGKSRTNLKKHGISFEVAKSVFTDENGLLIPDPDHSTGDESRFILLGLSVDTRVLVVAHCIRGAGEEIRIISARKATKNEFKLYWEEQV